MLVWAGADINVLYDSELVSSVNERDLRTYPTSSTSTRVLANQSMSIPSHKFSKEGRSQVAVAINRALDGFLDHTE